MSILVAILGFNLLVLVHELGHFLLARWAGMKVQKFSIGFGPAVLRAESAGGTVYQLGVLPFGGFVQIAGMGASERRHERWDYSEKSLAARAAVVLAGPLFNLGFAVAVYAGLFATTQAIYYESRPQGTPTIREVQEPAISAGLRPHDTIVAVNGKAVSSMRDILQAVGASEGRALVLEVVRSPEGAAPPRSRRAVDLDDVPEGLVLAWPTPPEAWPRQRISVTPERSEKGWRLGISLELARFGVDGPANVGWFALREVGVLTGRMVEGLKKVVLQEEALTLGGPVKITEMGADTFKRGPPWFLQFLAFLSVNLAFLNLLPIPALDGGRLMFLAVEAVSGRPLNRRTENLVNGVATLLLLGLIVVVTVGDIASLF